MLCYFCTGDVGQYTATGNLMIIDRKKDLVKLAMGEYVALSKVENALKSSQYTALPMLYATSSMSYCIALICPNVPNLKKLAASLSVEGELPALSDEAARVHALALLVVPVVYYLLLERTALLREEHAIGVLLLVEAALGREHVVATDSPRLTRPPAGAQTQRLPFFSRCTVIRTVADTFWNRSSCSKA